MLQRPPNGIIPETAGSYQFKDRHGRVIYVGKAKNLRARLANYFQNPTHMPIRTARMMQDAESLEWIQVDNEVEALMLEYSLIQRHQPRFNVRYRDDKSYPFLCVTMVDEWPRAMVIRGRKRKGNRYFGPFGHAYAIRETLDQLLRTFPIRTCSDNKFKHHFHLGRPCLLFHIEKCAGPCVDEVSPATYSEMVQKLLAFLGGDTDEVVAQLERDMSEASAALEFEQAARLRDRLNNVRKAIESQQMVGSRSEDFDVVGLVDDELEAACQVFYVRKGRVMGRRGFIVDKAGDLNRSDLISRVLDRLYSEENPLGSPKQVLVPHLPDNQELYEDWLRQQRGSKVMIAVPQRGAKRKLSDTVTRNAIDAFTRHRLKRAADHNTRAHALNDLQACLGMSEAPLRIECYDMSHFQGSDYVGSMVVMEDGLPRKSEYRRFKVRAVEGNDDYAAMEEVLTRRLSSLLSERDLPAEQKGKFAYPPQLLVVDGGKGQLRVAERVLAELRLDGEIFPAGLAKEFEQVYVPGQAEPVEIPRPSESLYLLQRIRDESHRFANDYHRQLRNKAMTRSVLDDIVGLGPVRKARVVKEMGGVRAVQSASLEDLQKLSWLPNTVAQAVFDKLHKAHIDQPGNH
ncbi:MAG: excinuclease ABC subunit UvrC [Acidimicrobiia bacterium]|nr:excinuclease ABC subunit UvrC [Acidimicrobiia bacterium]MYC58446.1 excinuclease ABC subunit UvrC [Acidimicrobiia bacterium]MYI30448.1 excinuclease ABC subunit UvrC [Acidimicrobiia bacterium]